MFVLAGIIVVFALFGFIVYAIIFYKKTQRLHLVERELLLQKYNHEIIQAQLEIQEQTLKDISQEIHDNIGQVLALAKLNLNAVIPAAEGIIQEKIADSKELVSKAIGDLRDLSRSMDTDYVKEMGLWRAIEYEMEMIQKAGAISANLQIEGDIITLDKQKELILFRIIQETFHNIIKHADATELHVYASCKDTALELLIADNGKGFDPAFLDGKDKSAGLGLRNMHNRAKLIGANFSINSTPEEGTEVKIVLPIEPDSHESK